MKSITSLVADIHKVLQGEIKPSKEQVESFATNLASSLAERLAQERPRPTLRMSNYAQPDRKLWYGINKPELAEELPASTLNKFNYGHIIEEYTMFLVEAAGHEVLHKQKEVTVHGVVGHIDGVIDGVVVDVKSANSRSFAKFRGHALDFDDPFGYRDQLSLYVEGSKDLPGVKVKKQGAFLAVDKELGHIVLDTYNVKQVDYEKETLRKRAMLAEPNPPPRCYKAVPDGKSGNLKLGVECSYCPFKKTCWPEGRTFLYSTGPRTLVKVEREPDVPEVKQERGGYVSLPTLPLGASEGDT